MKTLKKLFYALLTFAICSVIAPFLAVAFPFYCAYCAFKEGDSK